MPIEGRAVIVWESEVPVKPEPILIDEPGPGEVLVRILASGVCHTDLHVRDGKIGTPPILLGHEGAAIVEAVGPGVDQPQRRRLRDPRLARAVRHVPLLSERPTQSVRGEPECHSAAAHGRAVSYPTPILGIGLDGDLHGGGRQAGDSGQPGHRAGAGVHDRLRRDDRRRRRLVHGRRASWQQRGRVRLRHGRHQRHPGRTPGACRSHHRRGRGARESSSGRARSARPIPSTPRGPTRSSRSRR